MGCLEWVVGIQHAGAVQGCPFLLLIVPGQQKPARREKVSQASGSRGKQLNALGCHMGLGEVSGQHVPGCSETQEMDGGKRCC